MSLRKILSVLLIFTSLIGSTIPEGLISIDKESFVVYDVVEDLKECYSFGTFKSTIVVKEEIRKFTYLVKLPVDLNLSIHHYTAKDKNGNLITLIGGGPELRDNEIYFNFGDKTFFKDDEILIEYKLEVPCIDKSIESNKNTIKIDWDGNKSETYETKTFSVLMPSIIVSEVETGVLKPSFFGEFSQKFEISNQNGAASAVDFKLKAKYLDDYSSFINLTQVNLVANDKIIEVTLPTDFDGQNLELTIDSKILNDLDLGDAFDENETFNLELKHFIKDDFKGTYQTNRAKFLVTSYLNCGGSFCEKEETEQEIEFIYKNSHNIVFENISYNKAPFCLDYNKPGGAYFQFDIVNKSLASSGNPFLTIGYLNFSHSNISNLQKIVFFDENNHELELINNNHGTKTKKVYFNDGQTSLNTSDTELSDKMNPGVFNVLEAGKKLTVKVYYTIDCKSWYINKPAKVTLDLYNSREDIVEYKIFDKLLDFNSNKTPGDSEIKTNKTNWSGVSGVNSDEKYSISYFPKGSTPTFGGSLFSGCEESKSLYKATISYPSSFIVDKVFYDDIEVLKENNGTLYYSSKTSHSIDINVANNGLGEYRLEGYYNCSARGPEKLNLKALLKYKCGSTSSCGSDDDVCWFTIRDQINYDIDGYCDNDVEGPSCYTQVSDFNIERITWGKDKKTQDVNKLNSFYSSESDLKDPKTNRIETSNKLMLIQGDYFKIDASGSIKGKCALNVSKLKLKVPGLQHIGNLNLLKTILEFGSSKINADELNSYGDIIFTIEDMSSFENASGWEVHAELKSKNDQSFITRQPLENISFQLLNLDDEEIILSKGYDHDEKLIVLRDDVYLTHYWSDASQGTACSITHSTQFRVDGNPNYNEFFNIPEVRPFMKILNAEYQLSSNFEHLLENKEVSFTALVYSNTLKSSGYPKREYYDEIPLDYTWAYDGGQIKVTLINLNKLPYWQRNGTKNKILGKINMVIPNETTFSGDFSAQPKFKIETIDDINKNEFDPSKDIVKSPDTYSFKSEFSLTFTGDQTDTKTISEPLTKWSIGVKSTYSNPLNYIWMTIEKDPKSKNKTQINIDNLTFGSDKITGYTLSDGRYLAFLDPEGKFSYKTKNIQFDASYSNCISGDEAKFIVKIGGACGNDFLNGDFNENFFLDETTITAKFNDTELQGLKVIEYDHTDPSNLEKVEDLDINICDDFSYKIRTFNLKRGNLLNPKLILDNPYGLNVSKVELYYKNHTSSSEKSHTLTADKVSEEISLSDELNVSNIEPGDELSAHVFYKGDCSFNFLQPIEIKFQVEDICGKIISQSAARTPNIKDFELDKLKITDKIKGLEILDKIGAATNIDFSYSRDDNDNWNIIQKSRVQLEVPPGVELVKSDFVFNKGSNSSAKFSETFNSDGSTSYEWEGVDWSTDHELAFNGKFKYVGSFVNKSAKIIAKIGVKAELKCGSKTCKEWVDINEKDVKLVPISENPVDCEDCITSFSPLKYKKYVVSAWVSESSNIGKTNFDHAQLNVFIQDNDGPPSGSPKYTFSPSGQVIDGWQRIEGVFEIDNPNAMRIHLQFENQSNSQGLYLDDVRVSPANSTFVTYVYDPLTLRLAAELDEHNYATIYEYDEEGALIRVKKESERGIQTIRESRNNMKRR